MAAIKADSSFAWLDQVPEPLGAFLRAHLLLAPELRSWDPVACVRLLLANGADVDETWAYPRPPPLYNFFHLEAQCVSNRGWGRTPHDVEVAFLLLGALPRDNPLRELDVYASMRVMSFLWVVPGNKLQQIATS